MNTHQKQRILAILALLASAKRHAEAWRFPGGAFDNQQHYSQHIDFEPSLSEAEQMLLFDPQTSGGLLLGVPEDRVTGMMAAAQAMEQPAWLVGQVVPGDRIRVEA